MAPTAAPAVDSDRILHEAVDDLKAIGFVVTDVREANTTSRVVGYEPHRTRAILTLPQEKLALLWEAIVTLERRRVVPVDLVAGLLGLWVWGALLRRDLLSVPHHIFQFVRDHEWRGSAVW